MYKHHQPVMVDQVISMLKPQPGGRYVDLTLGLGGHARHILEACAPDGILLGVERDRSAIEYARQVLSPFASRSRIFHGCYSELPRFLSEVGWEKVDGMLADLGVSSFQLDDPRRGFGFQSTGTLDMRMDPDQGVSLDQKLAELDVDGLAYALRQLGEVKKPRLIARRILKAHQEGRLTDTMQLSRVAGEPGSRKKIHPATRVFLALRILVNQELEELAKLLARLPEPLAVGGRMVVISFHSLEDRKVKRRFRELTSGCSCPKGLPVCQCDRKPIMVGLTRRPLRPSTDEIENNHRSRSALLRAAERIAA